jgi:hypothetical protein
MVDTKQKGVFGFPCKAKRSGVYNCFIVHNDTSDAI